MLYRTLYVKESSMDAITQILDGSQHLAAVDKPNAMLQLSPTIRLCPHIRRVFVRGWHPFPYLRLHGRVREQGV